MKLLKFFDILRLECYITFSRISNNLHQAILLQCKIEFKISILRIIFHQPSEKIIREGEGEKEKKKWDKKGRMKDDRDISMEK